ncbi:MAG: hypothetical protein AAFY41_00780 [Bacteroidota bacterium]
MKDYNIYRVNSKAWDGFIYLRYVEGKLIDITLVQEMSPQAYDAILSQLPQYEQDILEQDQLMALTISENIKCAVVDKVSYQKINARSAKDKIVLFCGAFKTYRGVPYHPSQHEKANIKNVPVNKELLEAFFTSHVHNFTIDNYISRISIIRDHAKNGAPKWNDHKKVTSSDEKQAYTPPKIKNENAEYGQINYERAKQNAREQNQPKTLGERMRRKYGGL